MTLFCLALLSCALGLSQASVVLTPGMRTIGHALKGVPVGAGAEIELFAFPPGEAGVITEQWFSVFGGTPSGADPTIRVYYDGQGPGTPPSLEYRLFMAHGMGPYGCTDYAGQKNCSDPALRRNVPGDVNAFDNVDGGSWGSELLGHSSTAGALKNTYRVPFGAEHGIRITLQLPYPGSVYFYCRGMTNYPLIVGDLQLPAAARLRLHKNEGVTVAPHAFLPLVPKGSTRRAGMLFQVTLAADSSFIGFMEGCVRASIDNNTAPLFLSSGTEDYFEGANFFDTGLQKSAQAGVTWVSGRNPGPYQMTAFKHHVRDPVVWWSSFELTARNFDNNGVECGSGGRRAPAQAGAQPSRFSPHDLEPVTMSSYSWTYEWD